MLADDADANPPTQSDREADAYYLRTVRTVVSPRFLWRPLYVSSYAYFASREPCLAALRPSTNSVENTDLEYLYGQVARRSGDRGTTGTVAT